jgi:hypothetical protein
VLTKERLLAALQQVLQDSSSAAAAAAVAGQLQEEDGLAAAVAAVAAVRVRCVVQSRVAVNSYCEQQHLTRFYNSGQRQWLIVANNCGQGCWLCTKVVQGGIVTTCCFLGAITCTLRAVEVAAVWQQCCQQHNKLATNMIS